MGDQQLITRTWAPTLQQEQVIHLGLHACLLNLYEWMVSVAIVPGLHNLPGSCCSWCAKETRAGPSDETWEQPQADEGERYEPALVQTTTTSKEQWWVLFVTVWRCIWQGAVALWSRILCFCAEHHFHLILVQETTSQRTRSLTYRT
jgi:hypothetical protein